MEEELKNQKISDLVKKICGNNPPLFFFELGILTVSKIL